MSESPRCPSTASSYDSNSSFPHSNIFSRLSNSRSAQVTASNAETPLQYGFKGSSPETISFNQELDTNLLHLGNFTLIGQSFEQLATYYENPVFQRILRRSAFLSDQSCGPVHRDLWQCITIPCLAGVATNVERVLMEYQSGDNTSIKLSARNFRTKYLSHIISLADLYKVNGQGLRALLSRMAKELLSPFASLSLTVHSVQPRIPLSILAARYQQAQAIKATPVATVAGPSTRPRPKARQVEATPPSQPSTDDEIEDPGAWCAALDEGRPKEVFEQLIDSLGGSSDDEIGTADMTIVPQAGSGSTSAGPSTTTPFQATRGAAGDDGSESNSGSSEGEEGDGEGKSGAGRVMAVAGVEQSEESASEDEEEEEG
ncbi:hypothetical protein BDV93DRAFT_511089 [Ceratobasidium sp. AG-I]|nr:hypothetical protein BDV93DRAFT_511089 [Ceratobasidium sp. AG-I]